MVTCATWLNWSGAGYIQANGWKKIFKYCPLTNKLLGKWHLHSWRFL
uniref:Uncharacterized protein n=1 Tax=Anguilla anguilla TaxID=7936 RepID=A0A0E9WGG4_ANGAN